MQTANAGNHFAGQNATQWESLSAVEVESSNLCHHCLVVVGEAQIPTLHKGHYHGYKPYSAKGHLSTTSSLSSESIYVQYIEKDDLALRDMIFLVRR